MDTVTIPLTRGKSAIIDAKDYSRVSRLKWHAVQARSGLYYAKAHERIDGKLVRHSLHHFVLGASPDEIVDHRNGDGLDCRRRNIRVATAAQNRQNRRLDGRSSSGYKNVIRMSDGRYSGVRNGKHWRVMIRADKKSYCFGHYDDPEQAARIADAAMVRLHGEFARTNFPEVDPTALQYVDERLRLKRG